MLRQLTGSLAFIAAMSAATVSLAHIELVNPPPRHMGNAQQKDGPCGVANSPRGSTITEYQAGSTVTISWTETINHPGHYRLMFVEDGQAFPNPPNGTTFCTAGQETSPGNGIWCLADNITDRDTSAQGADKNYSATVTLPNTTCNNCTLQLIQWMSEAAAGRELYFKCSDVRLVADGAGGSGGDASSGAGGDGGVGGSGGAGASTSSTSGAGGNGAGGEPNGADPYPESGGCTMGSGQSTASAAALAALGLLTYVGRRRRTRR
ncbi:SCE4755 family polysaccharide monooxygenase-like protein [Chondromyces crocatus]|uniref:Copper acquisition factor BIM1-like domain-containing protein n=1 Tax=Chondromyces crocatus TaxID=52 RepID=A0A0K1EEJ6_CHOCO|nr:SCE4755 family polysaccharide monooxygenase-like protein [Chondromyces crocatus]AKT39097.1 uncharacterized protein CMC5_032440 [Chondromyces crocatus]